MFYLTADTVIKFNKDIQLYYNPYCLPRALDAKLVDSVLYSIKHSVVFDHDTYPTLEDKAGHLWYMLARFQAFDNGNKRTSIISVVTFLLINGYKFDFDSNKHITTDIYDLTTLVGQGNCEEQAMVEFIHDNATVTCDKYNPEDAYQYCLDSKPLHFVLTKLAEE